MKFYLASRYTRIGAMNRYAGLLRDADHAVTSRWIDGNHQIDDAGLSAEAKQEERTRFAEEDWGDLLDADCCLSFTEAPRSSNSRGGRHVEFGAALAAGLRCIVIGPRENVFHCLSEVIWHPDWMSFAAELDIPAFPICRVCGCTDDDCSGCVERTGVPCFWVEPDLCSACAAEKAGAA